ncbi:MAG: hypothetical protein AB7F31_01985 [Parachlamydiales bacterium]
MPSLLSLIGFGVVALLWGVGSGRRLNLVKGRIERDWAEVAHFLKERSTLLFQMGREEVVEAHEALLSALQEVEERGGPLRIRLSRLQEAERGVQNALKNLPPEEQERVGESSDRLLFATETYNDGIRLLKRLSRLPFHLPFALFICPRGLDLFETGSFHGGAAKLPFSP